MTFSFMPAVRTREELERLQLDGLRWTVKHAYQGSAFYRERLDEAGVSPERIRSLEDLQRLPFTTAKDLQEGYPFPLLSVPFEKVVRIHASSGTTGKRKVLCYTQKDIEDWTHLFARCYEMADLSTGGQGADLRGVRGLDRGDQLSAGVREVRGHGHPGGSGEPRHAVPVPRGHADHGHLLHRLHGASHGRGGEPSRDPRPDPI